MKNKIGKEILERYREGRCTDDEKALIEYWAHNLNEDKEHNLSETDFAEVQKEMWHVIKPGFNYIRFSWQAVAAVILTFFSIGIILFTFLNPAKKFKPNNTVVTAIKPGGNNAVLVLANGQKVVLDNAVTGQIAIQSGMKITKNADGLITYTRTENNVQSSELLYNTIRTPSGGQYQINLPDGSHVWLNAESSLRFPTSFRKDFRLVELSGEGYFEINHAESSKKEKVPFLVKTVSNNGKIGQIVKVLGTHFNINAYDDEDAVRTTLLEGSIQVSSTGKGIGSKILKPGEQTVLSNVEFTVSGIDTEAAVAWKNGYFRFNDESLEGIMRKVSRWYNVEVEYEDVRLKKAPFAGVITRFGNVSELLKMLELTGEVKFKVDGRKIFVLGKNTH